MAVIKYSGLVDQLRGKLNGTVFSRFNAGFNAYKKGQPSRWGSDTQQFMRQGFQEAARIWKNLTPVQRSAWTEIALNSPVANRLGEPALLPAYQYMLKFYQYSRAAGRAFTIAPNTSLQKPPAMIVDSAWLDATWQDGSYYISFLEVVAEITAAGDVPGYALTSISQPLDREDSNYFDTYYTVGSNFIGSWLEPQDYTWIEPQPTNMPGAWHTWDGAWHRIMIRVITELTAQELPPIFAMVQSNYTPPTPPEWVLSWVFPSYEVRFTELVLIGGVWQTGGSGSWYAGAGELLPGTASQYNVEIMASPNKYSDDSPKPGDFTVPRPTYSGVMVNKVDTAPFYFTPISLANFQSFLNSNFSYQGLDEYKYQPVAIRIQRPSDGVWSNWGYSNIWLPIF